ncbi:MAG: hypothetical protein ACTSQE_13160 [Candidatus Heimdallarchaeaceae archaeon]
MIHNLWIAKSTGECLYHRKYGAIDIDENLITSFLSAIEIFAQNVDTGCDQLETHNYKFVYTNTDQTVTVACIDKNDDERIIKQEISAIQEEFKSRFKKELDNWNGRVEIFASMNSFVDSKLASYTSKLGSFKNKKLELNEMIIKQKPKLKLSAQQEKVISLIRYKGTATLSDICKWMKLTEPDAEIAARSLLHYNIIREVASN